MAYTVADITELIRYQLLLSEETREKADANLAQLMRSIEQMVTTPRDQEPIYWAACEECGAWVSSELIGPDGAGENADGGFYCTECRFADEEP
jgi:hypothetical protein